MIKRINLFVTRVLLGIRHGQVIVGNEDNPYEIVNNSIPLLETYIERGVLSRVVAEILKMVSMCTFLYHYFFFLNVNTIF